MQSTGGGGGRGGLIGSAPSLCRVVSRLYSSSGVATCRWSEGGAKKKFPTFIPPQQHSIPTSCHPSSSFVPFSISPAIVSSHHPYRAKILSTAKMATKMEGMEHSEVHYFQRYVPSLPLPPASSKFLFLIPVSFILLLPHLEDWE